LGFVALSIVFFFAAYNLDFAIFEKDLAKLPVVILSVLVARAISVYASFYFSNKNRLFKDEPNVPMSWQHIINWGGLRGVIPLVLVLSLPDHFEYKADILAFTMGTLLFTLFVNGLTIERILIKLGLHLPKKEEELVKEESSIFDLEDVRRKIAEIKMERDFDQKIVEKLDSEILKEEELHRLKLLAISKEADVEAGLKIESLHIERLRLFELFNQGYIPESVYFTFEAQLDLQEDALEYPEVYKGRGYTGGGFLHTERSFRLRMAKFRELVKSNRFISKIFEIDEKIMAQNRYALLKARLVTTYDVYKYLEKVGKMFPKNGVNKASKSVKKIYRDFERLNVRELKQLRKKYKNEISDYQDKVLHQIIARELSLVHSPSH
jgi:hypothetical protein